MGTTVETNLRIAADYATTLGGWASSLIANLDPTTLLFEDDEDYDMPNRCPPPPPPPQAHWIQTGLFCVTEAPLIAAQTSHALLRRKLPFMLGLYELQKTVMHKPMHIHAVMCSSPHTRMERTQKHHALAIRLPLQRWPNLHLARKGQRPQSQTLLMNWKNVWEDCAVQAGP